MNRKLRKSAETSVEAVLREALELYKQEVNESELKPATRKTYLLHAENFVRWIEGNFTPGATL